MRVRLTTLLLLCSGAMAVPNAADAAAPECGGLAATIVGSPGEPLVGTDGPDVIVTNGALSVDARGGNDMVCATAMPDRSSVLAGRGDDTVVAEAEGYRRFEVDLGPGDDRFDGGSGRDLVRTYDPPGELHRSDVVSTGQGADLVWVTRVFGPATNDADQVDLGPGDDALRMGDSGLAADAVVVGGPGHDNLGIDSDDEGADVVIDARARTITRRGPYLQGWAGFESYSVNEFDTVVTFIGSPRREHVWVSAGRFVATLGGGRDEVAVYSTQRGELHGGSGRDEVVVDHMGSSAGPWIDLAHGRAGSTGRQMRARIALAGFEDATAVGGDQPLVVGNAEANSLVAGCGTVRGGGGADRIREATPSSLRYPSPDACEDFVAVGGHGDDVLMGSRGPDELLGGPGRDKALGQEGRDRCVAEIRHDCER